METTFSPSEIQRYSRHFKLPGFGAQAQRKLKEASVLCIGVGGLGSPAALYLAAAGIGRLGIADDDQVDLSNLQRQVLHSTLDVKRGKVDSAADRLHALNPEVTVEKIPQAIDAANAFEILSRYDLILDGSDNHLTRYLVNDACVILKKPNISATVFRFEGNLSIYGLPQQPCYRCLYPEVPTPELAPGCGETGVLGVVPGVLGVLQAAEAIKYLTQIGTPLVGRMLSIDLLTMEFRNLQIRRKLDCPVCSDPSKIDIRRESLPEVTTTALKDLLDSRQKFQLIDVRDSFERESSIEGSISIPLSEILNRAEALNSRQKTILYCQSGSRSAHAVEMLRKKGFEDVFSLRGGMSAWKN